MRKVHFIQPVEYIQGAIATRQTGVVGESSIPTYSQGTIEQRSVSGFKTTLICHMGQKSANAGKTWYAIRSKMTYGMNAGQGDALATFGGACALYNGIKNNPTAYNALMIGFASVKDKFKTFRRYVTNQCYNGLSNKDADISFEGTSSKVKNPWIEGGTGTVVTIPTSIVTKFASRLSED